MDDLTWLWIPATLAAAAAQTARNAMQRHLTASLGTVGATHVRFLYGFPFAVLMLAVACSFAGRLPPLPDGSALGWIAAGAFAQILATAAMLAAMRTQAFAVSIAFTKTEPVQVAIFAAAVLQEPVGFAGFAAIALATLGVMVLSGNPWAAKNGDWRAAAFGVAAGAFFALSAVCYRGGILALDEPQFWIAALTALALALGLQAVAGSAYLALRDRDALARVIAAWRPSLFAGLMGALASAGWFTAFSLASAALVRTLGLVEMLYAFFVGHRVFAQRLALREAAGLALVLAGVGLLLALSV
jgi:drug/metabolite transporter (DMT)-like permease